MDDKDWKELNKAFKNGITGGLVTDALLDLHERLSRIELSSPSDFRVLIRTITGVTQRIEERLKVLESHVAGMLPEIDSLGSDADAFDKRLKNIEIAMKKKGER